MPSARQLQAVNRPPEAFPSRTACFHPGRCRWRCRTSPARRSLSAIGARSSHPGHGAALGVDADHPIGLPDVGVHDPSTNSSLLRAPTATDVIPYLEFAFDPERSRIAKSERRARRVAGLRGPRGSGRPGRSARTRAASAAGDDRERHQGVARSSCGHEAARPSAGRSCVTKGGDERVRSRLLHRRRLAVR